MQITRLFHVISFCLLVASSMFYATWAQVWFIDDATVLTNEEADVIGADLNAVQDPLREWTFLLSENLAGIWNTQQLSDTASAWEKTTNLIKLILNYFLALIGLVALLYLLYHGFMAVTAWSNEEKLNKWLQGMRYAAIALFGIWLSWFIISIIFWLLQVVAQAV